MSLIIETDDQGQLTLSPQILGHPLPHARYEVEADGRNIRLVPVTATSVAEDRRVQTRVWLGEMRTLAQRFAETSTTDESAVDILSKMRR